MFLSLCFLHIKQNAVLSNLSNFFCSSSTRSRA
nr:MAG TPA: hypothetical protein [Bacteriophage sp.]